MVAMCGVWTVYTWPTCIKLFVSQVDILKRLQIRPEALRFHEVIEVISSRIFPLDQGLYYKILIVHLLPLLQSCVNYTLLSGDPSEKGI